MLLLEWVLVNGMFLQWKTIHIHKYDYYKYQVAVVVLGGGVIVIVVVVVVVVVVVAGNLELTFYLN